ncbi:MAG: hypothetical protein M1820_005498 [Bogoriella megaspora]|nr:MAG: hypothetical protein M1820_005498 [Bogoriella megaspora]
MAVQHSYSYSYFHLSKHKADDAAAQAYRTLRLQALQTSPESFSSTYEIESAYTSAEWLARLMEEGKETLICTATHTDVAGATSTEWVGQLTIRGPAARSDFQLPDESGQPLPATDDEEEKWQMLSLFNAANHRGRGIGKALCQEAMRYIWEHRSAPTVVVRLMVRPENHAAVRVYEGLGFEVVGRCTLAEALAANGESDLIPEDHAHDSRYSTRRGLIMMFRMPST